MRFGLEERHIKFILDVLNKNIIANNAIFYIFGSRARGVFKEYSDVDIAVDCAGEKADNSVIVKIKSDFENSTFPYEVDVVDLNSLDEGFLNIIKDDLYKIN